ncbi:MAG: molybdate ABC transporter substrate-binding protein [Bacteroidota bacterium]
MNIRLLALATLLLFASCQAPAPGILTIAAAANVQFVIEELGETFTEETGIPTEVILSSSGKLTAQILEGAPYDLFISANMKYPERLHSAGKTLLPPKIYAYGKLVLWTQDPDLQPDMQALKLPETDFIALANPKTAPYGYAAAEALKHYQLIESLRQKLVYGESISQTNQFITTRSARIGFTAKSVVLSPVMKDKGRWVEVDTASYSPIAQGVVPLQRKDGNTEAAEQFYHFLLGEKAQKILQTYGYQPVAQ